MKCVEVEFTICGVCEGETKKNGADCKHCHGLGVYPPKLEYQAMMEKNVLMQAGVLQIH